MNVNEVRKRISIISLKMVRESSLLYKHRQINSPNKAIGLFEQFIKDSDREKFIVISLDAINQPTSIEISSIGDLSSTIASTSSIMKGALISNAASILIGHNHPSGVSTPSIDDDDVTKRIRNAGEIIGINLLDHIIIGDGNYYSYKEEGKL